MIQLGAVIEETRRTREKYKLTAEEKREVCVRRGGERRCKDERRWGNCRKKGRKRQLRGTGQCFNVINGTVSMLGGCRRRRVGF